MRFDKPLDALRLIEYCFPKWPRGSTPYVPGSQPMEEKRVKGPLDVSRRDTIESTVRGWYEANRKRCDLIVEMGA
jgi:hypothetical protein